MPQSLALIAFGRKRREVEAEPRLCALFKLGASILYVLLNVQASRSKGTNEIKINNEASGIADPPDTETLVYISTHLTKIIWMP